MTTEWSWSLVTAGQGYKGDHGGVGRKESRERNPKAFQGETTNSIKKNGGGGFYLREAGGCQKKEE